MGRKTKEELIKELKEDKELRNIINREIDLEAMQVERFMKEQKPHEFSEQFNKNMDRLFDEDSNTAEVLEEFEQAWEEILEKNPDLRELSKGIEDFTNNETKEKNEAEETYHEFSKEFEEKMKRSIKEIKDMPIHPKVLQYKKKQRIRRCCIGIASGILLFIISFSIFQSTNATAISNFFKRIFYDDINSTIVLDGADSAVFDGILYEPKWLPRGYEKSAEFIEPYYYFIEYKKNTGHTLRYVQSSINKTFNQVNGLSEFKEGTIDNINYYYAIKDNYTCILSMDEEYSYYLSGATDLQTLLKIYKNIQQEEK